MVRLSCDWGVWGYKIRLGWREGALYHQLTPPTGVVYGQLKLEHKSIIKTLVLDDG